MKFCNFFAGMLTTLVNIVPKIQTSYSELNKLKNIIKIMAKISKNKYLVIEKIFK